jgi:hypothetical protein
VTFVQAALLVPCVVGALSVLWLLAYMPRNIKRDRIAETGGLDDLDGLVWNGWTPLKGWPPCWHGCTSLHRDDWWKGYVYGTCWHGCADLHRDDWWRAYVDQPEEGQVEPAGAADIDLGRTPLRRRRTLVFRHPVA